MVPRSPNSFVLCGATAPNGSFVNHQQLFGSVCKTAGLRIRSLFLAFLVLYLSLSFCSFSVPVLGLFCPFTLPSWSLFLAFLVPFLGLFVPLPWPFFILLRFPGHVLGRNFSSQKYLFFLAFLFPFLVLFLGPFWSLFYWPFLSLYGFLAMSWAEIYPAENTSVSLQGKESSGGNPKCLFNVVAL